MQTRLHSKYPDLAESILRAPPEVIRRMMASAVGIAIQNAGLPVEVKGSVLHAVEKGQPLAADTMAALLNLQEKFDAAYLDVQDEAEVDETLPPEALAMFYRARAIAAILRFEPMPVGLEAVEAIYEAISSSDREEEAVGLIVRAAAS